MEKNLSIEFYDQELETLSGAGLNYLPYIGCKVPDLPPDKRLIILGESCYAWKDNAEEIAVDPMHIRKNVYDHMFDSGFFTNIVKAVTGYEKITKEQREKFWELTMFHNLVTTPMTNNKQRPSEHDYEKGWNAFWELQKVLRPSACIMLGTDKVKINTFVSALHTKIHFIDNKELNLQYPKIGRYYAKVLDVPMHDEIVKFIFIKHPSSYFIWKNWHDLLKIHLVELLNYYQYEIIK
jgi:hypothetical protein